MKKLPSARVLRRLINYDPATGEMRWKERPVWLFKNTAQGGRSAQAASWNTRYAGTPALSGINAIGYRHGALIGTCQLAHRVAWAMHYDEQPSVIDHINGDPADNRIANLRSVTRSDNQKNMKQNSNNTTGVTGVYRVQGPKPWRAAIKTGGKHISLGRFDLKDDAIAARKAAERKYGFHPNHGRAA